METHFVPDKLNLETQNTEKKQKTQQYYQTKETNTNTMIFFQIYHVQNIWDLFNDAISLEVYGPYIYNIIEYIVHLKRRRRKNHKKRHNTPGLVHKNI